MRQGQPRRVWQLGHVREKFSDRATARRAGHSANWEPGGAGRRGAGPVGSAIPTWRISSTGCSIDGTRSGTNFHAASGAATAATTSVIRIANARQRRIRRWTASTAIAGSTAGVRASLGACTAAAADGGTTGGLGTGSTTDGGAGGAAAGGGGVGSEIGAEGASETGVGIVSEIGAEVASEGAGVVSEIGTEVASEAAAGVASEAGVCCIPSDVGAGVASVATAEAASEVSVVVACEIAASIASRLGGSAGGAAGGGRAGFGLRGPALLRGPGSCAFVSPRHLGLDTRPNLGLRLDRFDHEVQFAEPAFPQLHFGGECLVCVQQGPRLRAFVEIERAEHVFGSKRVGVVEVAHDLRHCSISSRLRRSEALSRSTGMSSLAASCSPLNAP